MKLKIYYCIVCSLLLVVSASAQATGESDYVSTSHGKDYFTLSESGESTTLFISSNDYPGVIRALNDLKTDIGKVRTTRKLQ